MRSVFLILRHEIQVTLHSPSYLLFALILPLLGVLILICVQFVQGNAAQPGGSSSASTAPIALTSEGFVDPAGLIRKIPPDFSQTRLLEFADEAAAQTALRAGQVSAYYFIPPDLLESGRVEYVYPDTRSYLQDGQSWVMARTLMFNMLAGDNLLLDWVWDPVREVTTTNLSPQAPPGSPSGEDCSRPGSACRSNDLVRYMPSIMTALFYFFFMTSSSSLFNSIGTEKENRMIEVLLVSVSPRQILAGKTIGLSLVGLLQALTWLGAIYLAFNLGGSVLNLPSGFVFPVTIVVWGALFFLGGYALYASLMAGAGALVPRLKEAGLANYIALFPLMVGYLIGLFAPLARAADTPLLVLLSLFPFTSPVVMVMRLTNSAVPIWQLVLSHLLLCCTAALTLSSAAAAFRAQNLLSGQPFSLARYLRTLAGR